VPIQQLPKQCDRLNVGCSPPNTALVCTTQAGKARYVFFSFPHIAITSTGTVGTVGRPGQDQPNFACGALIAALGQLKAEGIEDNIKRVGTHIATDPEYSILKQRIARRMLKVFLPGKRLLP